MALKKFNRGGGGVAFDAASSSGLAFLNAQLELPDMELVKPLTSMTHPRDITVKFGGGFVEFLSAYASDYRSTGGNQYGLQGTSNTDIATVQTTINKGLWKAWNWAASIVVTYIDLKKLQAAARTGQSAPFSLQTLLEDGVQLVWNKALERVTYLGWLGQPGLINNPNVNSSLAPATGTGSLRTWASKSPVQIQTDINFMLTQTVQQSAYSLDGMADTILIPWTEYELLMQPMTTGGFSSVLEFVLNNNIARQNGIDLKIYPLANDWIAGQGSGGSDRALAYRNNEKTVLLRAPQPCTKAMTVPSAKDGGAWETIYNGCIGQVQWLRTQPAYALDGIG
jgi:hypothetical protein